MRKAICAAAFALALAVAPAALGGGSPAVDLCKRGGWQYLSDHGASFGNQGACMRYARDGGEFFLLPRDMAAFASFPDSVNAPTQLELVIDYPGRFLPGTTFVAETLLPSGSRVTLATATADAAGIFHLAARRVVTCAVAGSGPVEHVVSVNGVPVVRSGPMFGCF